MTRFTSSRDGQGPILSIQYLRAFAAMLVVFHHARNPEPWLFNPIENVNFGARGVDIFFLISGFIMYTAARDEAVPSFLWRRFVRVVPLYWLSTVFFVALGLSFGEKFSRLNIVRSMLFIPFHNGSHENQIWPLLVPGWTLNYEMFFYALFAVALASGRLVVTLSVLIVGLAGLGAAGTSANALLVTYTNPLLLEFLAGVLIGIAYRHCDLSVLWPLLPVGIVALPLIGLLRLPGIIAGFAPALLIVTGALAFEQRGMVSRSRVGRALGDASYSIYLAHTLIMTGSNKLVAALPLQGWPQLVVMILVTLGVSTVGGIIVYRLVERPLLKALPRLNPFMPPTAPI